MPATGARQGARPCRRAVFGGITARYFASHGPRAATQDDASGSVRNLAMRMWRNPRKGLLQEPGFGPNWMAVPMERMSCLSPLTRHPGAGRDPATSFSGYRLAITGLRAVAKTWRYRCWIPACAGMTRKALCNSPHVPCL